MNPNDPAQPRNDFMPDIRQQPDGTYHLYENGKRVAESETFTDRTAAERWSETQQRRRAPTPNDGGVGGSRDR